MSGLLDDPGYPLLQEKISHIKSPENILKMLKNSFEYDGSIADSAPELKRIQGLKKVSVAVSRKPYKSKSHASAMISPKKELLFGKIVTYFQ
ncbi:hypothetical protein [Brevinema andersonii]|uniref:hypothetical protein n=1 Tax=Brevinema andersonii TaxID=34097 RepID=UPI000B838016|nr:hypothetical protein [Brevinema andersonii]